MILKYFGAVLRLDNYFVLCMVLATGGFIALDQFQTEELEKTPKDEIRQGCVYQAKKTDQCLELIHLKSCPNSIHH